MLAARRERGAALLASPGISHWAMLRVTRARAGRDGAETAVSVSQGCRLGTVGTCLPVAACIVPRGRRIPSMPPRKYPAQATRYRPGNERQGNA
jgi:hypothetical protein